MDSIWCVIHCTGFCISNERYIVREMAMCDLSGHHKAVFAYDLPSYMPTYTKLTPEDKVIVDEAIAFHGVAYESKYSARNPSHRTDDLDAFEAQQGDQYGPNATWGVWNNDKVSQAFLTGLGAKFTLINHTNLCDQPYGCVLTDEELYDNSSCAGHWLRKQPEEEWDDEKFDHRCSLEFACALAAFVRAETHYRSPTIINDLNEQRLLWQRRVDLLLEYMLCDDCVCDKSAAFARGEGIVWNDSDCDLANCKVASRILSYAVHQPWNDFYTYTNYKDATLDTLCVYRPHNEQD